MNNKISTIVGVGSGWSSTLQRNVFARLGGVFVIALSVMISVATFAVQANEPGSPAGKDPEQSIPNAARGKKLAESLCVNCHLVSSGDSKTASDRVPSFHEIANRPKQTAQRIRQAILLPHHSMPEIALTTLEIDNIIAYLDELRTEDAGTDLLPLNEKSPELELPEPS